MQLPSTIKKFLVIPVGVIVTVYFVFIFKIDISHYRFLQEFWNLGHVFLFSTAYLLFYKPLLKKLQCSISVEIFIVIILSAFFGLVIEYIQLFTGRDKSYYDVLLDVVGGLIGFVLFTNSLTELSRFYKHLIRASIVLFTLGAMYPMAIIIFDDINQAAEFPTIISNIHNRELSRYQKENIKIELVDNIFKKVNTNKVLKLTFLAGDISSGIIGRFNQNWSAYKSLKFTIYNPYYKNLTVDLRIHDTSHKDHYYAYNDRYNSRLLLVSGLNDIVIRLNDVENSPFTRKMNMKKIDQIIIFKSNLKEDLILFIDNMRLTK